MRELTEVGPRHASKEARDLERAARELVVADVILRAHATGMLFVPPWRDKIDAGWRCASCGRIDFHADGCRPPQGLRRLTLAEIKARDAGVPNGEVVAT